eukprot:scaffold208731_cov80-Attheya_sp.AAC.1
MLKGCKTGHLVDIVESRPTPKNGITQHMCRHGRNRFSIHRNVPISYDNGLPSSSSTNNNNLLTSQ